MSNNMIKQKIDELDSLMKEYKHDLNALDQELFHTISEYQKSIDEERIREIREKLKNSHEN